MATLLLLYLAHLPPTLSVPVQQETNAIKQKYDLCTSDPSACTGLIVGIIAFVCLAGLLVLYLCRRRRRRKAAKEEMSHEKELKAKIEKARREGAMEERHKVVHKTVTDLEDAVGALRVGNKPS